MKKLGLRNYQLIKMGAKIEGMSEHKTKKEGEMNPKYLARTVANEVGIEPEIFTRFMAKRFPYECDYCYVKEWAERFKSGNPVVHMDKQSKEIYFEICKEF